MACWDFHGDAIAAAVPLHESQVALGSKIFTGVLCEPRMFSPCSMMCSLAVDLSCWKLGQLWPEIAGLQFSWREWCAWVCVLTSVCGWESCWKKGACFQEMCGATSLWYDFELPPSINPQPKSSQGDAPCVLLLYEDKTSNYLVDGPPLTRDFLCVSPFNSRPGQCSSSKYGHSVPIPVPTQIHNYRRIEQNLQSPNQYASPR